MLHSNLPVIVASGTVYASKLSVASGNVYDSFLPFSVALGTVYSAVLPVDINSDSIYTLGLLKCVAFRILLAQSCFLVLP